MKANWQTKKLGEVLEYEQPTPYIVSSKNYKEEYETPVLTAGKSFILGKTKEKNGIFPKDKLPVIIFDDFTTATKFVDFPFKVKSSAMKILHPVKNISDAKFLFHLIQNISFDHTGIHKRYWISEYSKIEIPLPPLPEQHRIVKILDEVFADLAKAKENAEKNLQNTKELFESYLHSVFANPGNNLEEKTLADVCEIKSKLVDPRKSEFLNMIHVGAGNMITKSEILIDLKTSKEEKLISGKFLFDNTMILYSKIRPYLMKVIRPNFDGLCSADIYPLSPIQNKITRDYLFHLLLTQDFTQYAIKGSGRAGMPKVNRDHLFAYKFYLPSLKKQKSIVAKLDSLSTETKKLEAIYKRKLEDLEELKKSILKKAFNGEL